MAAHKASLISKENHAAAKFSLQIKDHVFGLLPLLGIKRKERVVQNVDEGVGIYFAFLGTKLSI